MVRQPPATLRCTEPNREGDIDFWRRRIERNSPTDHPHLVLFMKGILKMLEGSRSHEPH